MEMQEDVRSDHMIKKKWYTKLGLGLALFLLVLISFVTFNTVNQFENSSKLVDHTHLVIKQINQVALNVKYAESAQRGYLITSNESFLQEHHDVVMQLPDEIKKLRYLTKDIPDQQESIEKFEELIDTRMRVLRLGIDMLADHGEIANDEVTDLVGGEGRQAMQQLRGYAVR